MSLRRSNRERKKLLEYENTTKDQFATMVDFLKKYPFLVTNVRESSITMKQKNKLWKALVLKLNEIGPPVKTKSQWKKKWADLKNRTKKKELKRLNSLKKNDGSPNNSIILTDLENDIIDLSIHALTAGKSLCVPKIEFNDPLKVFANKKYTETSDSSSDEDSVLSSSDNNKLNSEYLEEDCTQEDRNELNLDSACNFRQQQNETQEDNNNKTDTKMDFSNNDIESKIQFRSGMLYILNDIKNTLVRGIEQKEKHHKDLMKIEKKKLKLRELELRQNFSLNED